MSVIENPDIYKKDKDNLIKQEIIDKKYNLASFSLFLKSKKVAGNDIDQWTYKELVSVIKEYQIKCSENKEIGEKDPLSASQKSNVIIDPLTMIQIKSKEPELIKYTTASKVVLAPSSNIQIVKPKSQTSDPQPHKILSSMTPAENQIIANEVEENKELQVKSISPRAKDIKEEESKIIVNKNISELDVIANFVIVNPPPEVQIMDDDLRGEDEEQGISISPQVDLNTLPGNSMEVIEKPSDIPTEFTRTTELHPGILTEVDLKIKVQKHFVKEGGFFGSTQVEYEILSVPCGWKVKRSFLDCQWLKEQLLNFHPSTIIPPLQKKIFGDKNSDVNITLRKRFIQTFFDELVKNNELKSSDILYQFLIIVDPKQFQLKKKEISKCAPPASIYEIPHFGGTTNVYATPETLEACGNIINYASYADTQFEKLIAINNQISTQFEELGITLNYASNIYSEFSNLYRAMKCPDMSITMEALNKLCLKWQSQTQNISRQLRGGLTEFFRYYTEQVESIQQLAKVTEATKSTYLNKMSKLLTRKEKVFTAQDLSQMQIPTEQIREYGITQILEDKRLAFELMLPKESKELEEKMRACGYYSNRLLTETQRVSLNDSRIMKCHFVEVATLQSAQCLHLNQVWSELIIQLTEFEVNSAAEYREKLKPISKANNQNKIKPQTATVHKPPEEHKIAKRSPEVGGAPNSAIAEVKSKNEDEENEINKREALFDLSREESDISERKSSSVNENKTAKEFYVRNYDNLFDD